jgi:long-chain acyl-CoA synthetase
MGALTARHRPGAPPGDSLATLLAWRAEEGPDFRFLWVEDQGPWTFGGLAAASRRVAGELGSLGLGRGDRAIVRAGNSEHFLPAVAGAWSVGVVAILVHPATPVPELRRIRDAMGPAALIHVDGDPVPDAGLPAVPLPAVPTEDGSARLPVADLPGSDPAVILLTSGSTGLPKGIVLTHDNAWANVRATVSAFRSDTSPSPLPATRRPPNLIANPMTHTGGLVRLLFGLYVGRSLVVLRKFSASAAKRAIDRHGITSLTINPTMMRMLLDDLPDSADLGPVRYVSSGTAPLPDALRIRFEERFSVPVLQSYGQTESFGALAIERATDVLAGRRRPGSVGRPLPGITVRLVGDDGREVAPGEVGELWARSPAAAAAVAGETGGVTDAEGWLHTGDLARADDGGYLYIVGRKRGVIICGGFNIVPEELESVLAEVPGVRDAVVLPRPDERLGEIPVAVIEGQCTAEEVTAALRERVAPYKRPRQVLVVAALPRLASGKVDKRSAARLLAS